MRCKVEEVIYHQTQKEPIVKYIVRPYGVGLDKCVTVEEKDLVINWVEAYQRTREYIDNLVSIYNERLAKFSEEYFENREKEYQQSLENKKVE
jgi:hypothetical protein